VASAPAAYAGLVLVPGSPRSVTIQQAEALARYADSTPLAGVFQDAPLKTVIETARRIRFAAIQLHGAEDAAYFAAVRKTFDGEIWLAQHPSAPPREGGDRLLFDNGRGGTGKPLDWGALAGHPSLERAILAGGIGAHNVRKARDLGTFAIDVGSATDTVPGTKDHSKIAALFDALRPVSRNERLRKCA
jgi:indole-3-glycerol phosphate synthase/phosphoribosylanthranilate isomerase